MPYTARVCVHRPPASLSPLSPMLRACGACARRCCTAATFCARVYFFLYLVVWLSVGVVFVAVVWYAWHAVVDA